MRFRDGHYHDPTESILLRLSMTGVEIADETQHPDDSQSSLIAEKQRFNQNLSEMTDWVYESDPTPGDETPSLAAESPSFIVNTIFNEGGIRVQREFVFMGDTGQDRTVCHLFYTLPFCTMYNCTWVKLKFKTLRCVYLLRASVKRS